MTVGRTNRVYRDAWTPELDAALMDCAADGLSFAAAAKVIGTTKDQAKNRFNRLARRMGEMAR